METLSLGLPVNLFEAFKLLPGSDSFVSLGAHTPVEVQ